MVTIPKSWRVCKVADVAEVSRGASPRPIESYLTSNVNGVNWIKIGDAPRNGNRIGHTAEHITPEGALRSVIVRAGDLILSNSMSFGRPYVLDINGCIHDGWIKLSEFSRSADTEFLVYLLSSRAVTSQYESLAAGSGVKNLNKEVVREVALLLPQLAEQRAIAEVLSGFDEHLVNLDELIVKKKAIRDGATDELVLARRRLGSFSDPWTRASIPECADILAGLTYSPDDLRKSGVLVLRSSNIQNDTVYLGDNIYVRSEAVNSPMVERGDILVCVRNGSVRLIGKTAQIDESVPTMSTFGAFMSVLRPTATDSQFLFYYTRTRRFKDQVTKVLGATINQITKRDLAEFDLLIPPLEEQRAIAEVLSGMDEEIRLLEEERVKVERVKLGAMDDLLTGRVRLPVGEKAA